MCLQVEIDIGEIVPWSRVAEVHKIRNGIYQRNGRLVSLLTDFGRITPCYPDFHGDTTDIIHYTGSGRRGNQKLDTQNQALLDATRSRHPVPLFNKLGVNRWQYLGNWRVTSGDYVFDGSSERMVWRFVLEKA